MGEPNGAMICLITCLLFFEVGHPGAIETTSPVLRDEFGSCTR